MSAKRGMSKQQRLYYEHNNKEKVKEELAELAKQMTEVDRESINLTFNPHRTSYFNLDKYNYYI